MTAFNRVGIAATVLAVSVALARAQTIETPAVAAAKVTIARDIAPSLPRVSGARDLTLAVSDLAVVPSFMSEAARLRQAQRWAAALRPGTTRTEVEGQLDHPIEDGGLNMIGHTRYYLGFDVKLDVPFAIAAPLRHAPTDRVSGPAVVSRGGYSMD
ncbi:MAG TPA: hypothetical protein VHD57_03615 [Vicinamibacterales bacterium]|jgi:hypothetical protein|nr:hypothetical protein [Vicinamibacterales bacterium]